MRKSTSEPLNIEPLNPTIVGIFIGETNAKYFIGKDSEARYQPPGVFVADVNVGCRYAGRLRRRPDYRKKTIDAGIGRD